MNAKNLQFAAVSLLLLAVPAGGGLATTVIIPSTFVAGTNIRAADVNANFTAVKTAVDDNATRLAAAETSLTSALARITALEAASAARATFYAESAFDGAGSVDDTWVDLPGVTIPVSFDAPTKIRYQLFARIYNYGGTTGIPTSCSVQIVKDDASTPLFGSFPTTLGDWNGVLTGGDISPNNSQQVALGGLVTVPAGNYNFKVQVVRKATPGLTNSGTCSIFRWNFGKARFFIDLVP